MLILINGDGRAKYALNVFHISTVTFEGDTVRFDLLNKTAVTLHGKTSEDFDAYLKQIADLKTEAQRSHRW